MSAGRRLALRATVFQAGATALVALTFLPHGLPSALGALVGGGALQVRDPQGQVFPGREHDLLLPVGRHP